MPTYYFISKMRSLDIEGVPGGIRNYQYSTSDEKVAEILRSKRDVSEVVREGKKLAPKPELPQAEVTEVENRIEAIAEGASPVVSGMRTSTTKQGKPKIKKEKNQP